MLTAAAMADVCLLLPAGAPTAPEPEEKPTRPSGPRAARCLFGRPDPGVAAQLLQDQLALERDRLLWRFGFDVVAALAGDADRPEDVATPPGPSAQQRATAKRARPTPYHRQSSVKDFYKVQKAVPEKKMETMVRCVEAAITKAVAD